MAIRLNEDKEIVARIREGLKMKGGYCPCRLEKSEDNKCICKEFREQQEEGECHCGRFIKQYVPDD
jgi:ferredoxin-thioredoxin reductase catalytic subunit